MQPLLAGDDTLAIARSGRAVARSQYVLLLSQVARVVLFVLVTAVLGQSLDAAAFGFFALVSTLFVAGREILDMGTTAVATRELAREPASEQEVLRTVLSWRRLLAIALALGCAALSVTGFERSAGQGATLLVAAAAVLLLPLTAYHVVFQVRQAFGPPVAVGLGSQVGFLAAVVGALAFGAAGVAVAALVVAREVFQVVASAALAARMLGARIRAAMLEPGIGRLLRAGWAFGLAVACYKLAFNAGTFFLWVAAPAEALGTYGAAHRIFAPLQEMTWLFVTPLIAAMSVTAVRDEGAFRRTFTGYLGLMAGASAAIAVCAWILAPAGLRILYGGGYLSGSLDAVPSMRWMAAGFAMGLVLPVLVVAELARNRERTLLGASAAALAVNVVVNAAVVPAWGAEGAAFAGFTAEAVVFAALLLRAATRGEIAASPALALNFLPSLVVWAALVALDGSPGVQILVAAVLVPAALLVLWNLPAQRALRRPP